ncbi:MAG: hemolysin III family protein [Rhodobacteraceae bacterium]|nr:hemolysin III family protein [Paracoccaceae bacterium]
MRNRARVTGVYSRAERLSDAAVHVVGILLALLAAPVLVTLAAVWLGDRSLVLAAIVYGLSLIAMLCASALYHMTSAPDWKDRLRRLDQSAIYLKIAGTYTPFAVMSGPQAMPFLAGLWAAAAAGVSIKLIAPRQLFGLTLALYLAMGWAAVVAGAPILDRMTPEGFRLVLAGGSLYTIGVFFLIWERLPFHTTIWHVFVLTASLILYAAVLIEIAGLATA